MLASLRGVGAWVVAFCMLRERDLLEDPTGPVSSDVIW